MKRPKAEAFRDQAYADCFDWVAYGIAVEKYAVWAESQLKESKLYKALADEYMEGERWKKLKDHYESQLKESKKEIETANIHIQKMNERDQEILELKAQLNERDEAVKRLIKWLPDSKTYWMYDSRNDAINLQKAVKNVKKVFNLKN